MQLYVELSQFNPTEIKGVGLFALFLAIEKNWLATMWDSMLN